MAAIPFLLLLADRPDSVIGQTVLPTGASTETYTVETDTVHGPGSAPRLHHLGFWLEALQWDQAAGVGSLRLRDAAESAPVQVSLRAGEASSIGPYEVTPLAIGRASTPSTVRLQWELRGGEDKGEVTVPVGGRVELPGGRILRVAEARAAFNRQGPAVHVDIDGDSRWLLRRYPDHDADHRTGPVGLRWKSSGEASIIRLGIRPRRASVRAWLAEHPPPPAVLLFALLLGLTTLRGRSRGIGAVLLAAAAIWALPGRTAPSIGGDYSAPPYAHGESVTVNMLIGPEGGPADVSVPFVLRLPVGGAGPLLGLAFLLFAVAAMGFAAGGAGITHGRSALRAGGLLLAALALFLVVRPWLGPVPEVDPSTVASALRVYAPAPPGRMMVDWSPSAPGPYAPGPAAPDLALLAVGAIAGVMGARRR